MTKVRLWFYLISGVLASVVPVLLALGVINETQGNSWMTAVGSIGSLIGATGAITAGTVLNKQVKSGTVGSSPVEQVIHNIPMVVKQAHDAAHDLDRVRQAATDALSSMIPVGPLAQRVIDEVERVLPR